MPVTAEPTPNPNAMKFSVGRPVGGPATFSAGQETDDPIGSGLLGIDGVASVFMTADFVTVTKDPEASWDDISPRATAALESHFG
ncbi:MAG TPA: NifU N-terminal domain-containing protein [Acidimicrobiia bacterium]|nr:NifU N-terminal domain-containing protein [Acidimicrobiia bacterium]